MAGSGYAPKWKRCGHNFPMIQNLRYPYPSRKIYGTIEVCIKCRAKRFKDLEKGETVFYPPVPREQYATALGQPGE